MSYLEDLFIKILNMGITAGYVIIAVLLLRICLRKAPKRFTYYLWAAVGFRLLCPISFSSIISIFNFRIFQMNSAENNTGELQYIPSAVSTMPVPKVSVGIPAADHMINHSLPAATPTASVNPMQIILSIATALWLIGIAVFLAYGIISYLLIKKRISKAVILKDNVYECDSITSPFVLGILRPRIYIPFRLKEQELDYILRHERFHIKRKDYLIKPFSSLLLLLYWFHPLVWVSYVLMSRDMEMSCDEKVLSDMGASVKNAYSLSLLSFAANHRFPAANPLAFGESDTKGRIKNILKFKKSSWWISVIIGLLCIIAVISFAANPLKASGNKDNLQTAGYDQSTEVSDLARQLYDNRNPYIGDAPADGTLLKILGIQENIGAYTLELETKTTPYILRINFRNEVTDRDSVDFKMMNYASVLLALIDNADEIQWSYPSYVDGQMSQIIVYWNQKNLDSMGIENIKGYGEAAEKVQELLNLLDNKQFDYNSFNTSARAETTEPADNTSAGAEITQPADNTSAGAVVTEPADNTSGGITEAESEVTIDDSDENASDTELTMDDSDESASDTELTMDTVLAQKDFSKLTLDYFEEFDNAAMDPLEIQGALNACIMFELTYEGKPYELQISYLKSDQSIDSITLVNKTNNDRLLMYSVYPLYTVNTDVESFLKKNITMDMYLSYQLPEGFVNAPYTATLWMGGNYILKEGEQPTGPESAPAEWYVPGGVMRVPAKDNNPDSDYVTFQNGKLINVDYHNNYSWPIGETLILENVKEQAVLLEVEHELYTQPELYDAETAGAPIPIEDQTSRMWEIYFARENSEVAYCIFLNEKYFTKEDAVALAQSVLFTDSAFQ